jgi:hypothetical protein
MIADEDVLAYIAKCAESVIEDDLNETGRWTDDEFDELRDRALGWCGEHRA